MPAPRVFTPDMRSVSEVIDQALTRPTGVVIFWRVGRYGSLQATATLSRRFQQAFCAVRSRARRFAEQREQKGLNYAKRDLECVGPYDHLACQRVALADGEGWKVEIFKDTNMTGGLEIADLDTEELLEDIGVGRGEYLTLLNKAIHQPREFTAEDWDRLSEVDENPDTPWHTHQGRQWFPRPRNSAPTRPTPTHTTNDPGALTDADDAFDAAIDAFEPEE